MKPSANKLLITVKVIGQMLFLFAFLAWLDGAVIQITHPSWLPLPVSHLLNVRLDNFTIAMFFISALGFLMWRLPAEFMKAENNKTAPD